MVALGRTNLRTNQSGNIVVAVVSVQVYAVIRLIELRNGEVGCFSIMRFFSVGFMGFKCG